MPSTTREMTRLIAATLDELRDVGPEGLTVERIARRAGLPLDLVARSVPRDVHPAPRCRGPGGGGHDRPRDRRSPRRAARLGPARPLLPSSLGRAPPARHGLALPAGPRRARSGRNLRAVAGRRRPPARPRRGAGAGRRGGRRRGDRGSRTESGRPTGSSRCSSPTASGITIPSCSASSRRSRRTASCLRSCWSPSAAMPGPGSWRRRGGSRSKKGGDDRAGSISPPRRARRRGGPGVDLLGGPPHHGDQRGGIRGPGPAGGRHRRARAPRLRRRRGRQPPRQRAHPGHAVGSRAMSRSRSGCFRTAARHGTPRSGSPRWASAATTAISSPHPPRPAARRV